MLRKAKKYKARVSLKLQPVVVSQTPSQDGCRLGYFYTDEDRELWLFHPRFSLQDRKILVESGLLFTRVLP